MWGHKEWKSGRDSGKGVLMWQGEEQDGRTQMQTSCCGIPTTHICMSGVVVEGTIRMDLEGYIHMTG